MTPPQRRPDRDGSDDAAPDTALTEIGRYAGHGVTLGLSTALFAWVGDWVDGQLGTRPLFVVLGAALGFAGGFYNLYRALVRGPATPPGDGEGKGEG